MCSLSTGYPLILSAAVIFYGGQLLACHVCTEIYPQEGLVHVHSHTHYVRLSSFSSCSSCSPACDVLQSTNDFWTGLPFLATAQFHFIWFSKTFVVILHLCLILLSDFIAPLGFSNKSFLKAKKEPFWCI